MAKKKLIPLRGESAQVKSSGGEVINIESEPIRPNRFLQDEFDMAPGRRTIEGLAEQVAAENQRRRTSVSFEGLQDMRPSYMRQQAMPAVPQSQVSMNSLLQTGQRDGKNHEQNQTRAQSFNDYASAVRRARADADGFQQAVERGRGMTHNGLDADLDYKDALGFTSRRDKRTTAMGALTWRTPENEAKTNSMLSDQEKQNYYYLAATQGRQEAENYRQYLLERNKINEQLGQERYERVKDASLPVKAVTAFNASMAGAAEQTANVGNAVLGRASIKAATPAEHLAQAIEQGENDTSTIRGRVAHKAIQLANTVGTNMPSMVAGAVFTPGVGSAMFATQAAGAAYQEVINNGGTVQQAQEFAALQAIDEEITNALLGGIAERGGGMLKNMLKDTAIARNLHGVLRGAFTNNPVGLHVAEGFINALADGGSEAAQEYVQYFTERFERWLATGEAPTYNVNGEQKTYEQIAAELGQQGAIEAIAGNPEAIESALMGFLNAELMGGVRGAGNTLNTLQMGNLASADAYAGLADSVNPNVLQYRSEDTYRKGKEVQNYARDQIRRAEAGRENSLSSVYGRGLMLQAAQEYADAVAETEMDDMSSEDALRQAAEERLANARPDHENAIDRTNRIRATLRGDNAQAAWDTVEDTSGRHEFVIPADTREQAASDLLESQDADRVSWNTEQGEVALDRESDGSYTFTNERGESVTMDAAQAVDLIPAGQNITVQSAAAETAPSTESEAPSTEAPAPSTETTAPTTAPSTETTASSTAAVQTAAENVTKTAPVTYREKMQEAIRNNPNSQRLANERAVRASQDLSTHFGEAGQKLFKQMDPKTAVQNYRAFSQVYNYARFGGTMELSNEASMILGPEATAAAIRAGNEDANAAFPEQTVSSVRNAVSKVRTTGTAGRVTFAKGAEYKNLTNQQKLRADYAGALITKVLGMDVHFVQSSTKDGRYQGMNGSYSRVNGRPTITLDVNAGMNMESDWTGEVTDIKTMLPVISHELTHWMEKSHPDLYREIQNAVISTLANDSKYAKGVTINAIIAAERQRLNETVRDENGNPVQHTNEDAIHEMVARACEEMLSGSKQAAQAFENLDAESKNTLWNHIKEVFNSIREFFEEMLGSYRSDSPEAKAIRRNMEEFEKIRNIWQQALNGGEYAVNPDITSTEFHDGIGENGINISSDSVQQMSERTYEEGGRKYLDNWLKRQVKSNKITEQDRTDIMRALDEMKRIMEDIRTEEGAEVDAYSRWADTRAKEDRYKDDSGKWQKAFTAIVNNGEYKMNIDFSTVCKKRTALNSVLNAMVTSGDLNFETLTASEVVELNNIIKEEGFEIACALCFVDSKRYRIGSWAESFCEGSGKDGKAEDRRYGWNEIVRSMVPEGSGLNIADFNFTNRIIENNNTNLLSDYKGKVDMTLINEIKKNFGKTTEAYRMADTLQKNPSMRKLLAPAEMISSAGLDLIKAQNKTLFKLINSHQGTAKPKLAFDNVAYNNDILKTQWTPGAALKVGGVRLQSFSDFQANMVFDYVQMVGEMQAKGLSCHSYTKEASFVAIFGKTGIKINMSLVPKSTTYTAEQVAKMSDSMREKLKATAGLDKDGNYIWEDETFPYEVAMHIQEDPEYAKNCGTIAVGVSDPHIRKLLADPRIQMVIPYHKSSINHVVAALRNIALYNDYTDFQNTRTLDGKKLDGVPDFDFYAYMYGLGDSVKATKKDGSYDASGTNANIRKLHENWKNGKIYDGKTVANAYLDWCEKKGEFANREGEVYLPRFDQFAYNEDGTRNENYYKLLADFRLYDENGNPAPQQAVQSVYPDNVKDLIVNGYKFQDGDYHYENGGLKNATQVRDDLTRKTPEIIKRFKEFRERGYSEGEIAIMQQAGRTEVALEERMEEIRNSRAQMSLREDYDESSPSMISDSGVQYSHRITDEDTLDRLNKEVENGDYIVTYKAMQKIGDELYPPMAAKVKGEDGKYRMQNPSRLNVWQEADEDTTHIKFKKNQDYGYYVLNKGDGSSVEAAYNPYEHSSNLVLNDQFEGAYKRDNLVVVKCIIPKSEIYGENRYKAQYAKDSTGVLDWKSGVVAGQLKDNKRQVYLSRYLMPVEIVPTDEVARMWKDTLKGSDVVVPFNVVQPSLLKELEKVGIPIDYEGSPIYKAHHKTQMSQRGVDLDKRIDALVKKYGAIPKGEKPARNVDVPMQTSDNKNTRRFVRTILESGITSAELDDNIKSAIINESLSYEVATDKDAAEYAASVIRIGGVERAQREWDKARRSDTFNKDHMALGQFLLKEYAKNNDIDNAMNMIQDLAAEGTRMGQNIQAMRMLKKYAQQVPAIGLGYIQRTVDQMNREAKAKMGKRYKEMKIAPNLATEYINAQTRDEIDAALGKIYKNLGSQVQKTVPEEIIDHLRTWRYMSMLGNPRTHIRNLVGNALFVPAVTLKNAIGAELESRMNTGTKTKSLTISKQAMEFAKKDAVDMKDVLSGESEKSIRDLIMDQRKVYKFEPLNKASQGNSAALEAEDWVFLRWHYQNALAQYITANNLDTTVQNPAWLGRARNYAVQEAQKATYRDANKVSTWLNQSKTAGAVVKYMMEGLMPFKKTPTNILRRGIEYSPAGLVRTMSKGIYDLNTGKMTVNEWIDALSSGLSGTAIFGLGMFLASTGAILGGYEDDDDKELRKLKGLQEYSVQIGNHTYTIDWAAPGSLPLFIGVETMNALRQERGLNMDDMGKAAARLIDPMINMSMLSGLNDTLDAISYADDKLSAATMEMFYSLLGQYVPTLFGQVARTIDTTQRINYQDANTGMSKNMLYFIEKMQNKIPYLTFSNDPYLNEFGQENSGTPHWAAALQNFVSPGYISEIKDDRVIDEVARLNAAQDSENVLPKKMPKYFGTKEDRVDLTSAQYHTFQKTAGQTAYNILDAMIDDSRYSKMTAEQQANAIKMAYDYSKAVGRIAVQPEYEEKLTGDKKKIYEAVRSGSQAYDAILTLNTAKGIKQEVTYDKSAGETQKGATLEEIMSSSASQEEKGKVYASLYPSEGLTNWTKSGGSSYDYMMGQRLADDIPDGEESYQFVYSSSKYTKQQKSAWLQSQKRIVNSDGYKLWKKANGLDMDFIKYKADLKKFKGKGKKQKTLNYINSQTTNEAKREALRKMAGY